MRWQWIGSWAAGRLWCAGESWPSCTEGGRRSTATRFKLGAAASKSTLRFVEDASRPGGSATASRSPAAGGSAASAQGLLGDSGGCDAAGAAAAELAARHSRRRWREFPVESAARGWCCAPWTGSPGSGEMPTEAPAWLRQPRASQRAGACTGPSSWQEQRQIGASCPCQEVS